MLKQSYMQVLFGSRTIMSFDPYEMCGLQPVNYGQTHVGGKTVKI